MTSKQALDKIKLKLEHVKSELLPRIQVDNCLSAEDHVEMTEICGNIVYDIAVIIREYEQDS